MTDNQQTSEATAALQADAMLAKLEWQRKTDNDYRWAWGASIAGIDFVLGWGEHGCLCGYRARVSHQYQPRHSEMPLETAVSWLSTRVATLFAAVHECDPLVTKLRTDLESARRVAEHRQVLLDHERECSAQKEREAFRRVGEADVARDTAIFALEAARVALATAQDDYVRALDDAVIVRDERDAARASINGVVDVLRDAGLAVHDLTAEVAVRYLTAQRAAARAEVMELRRALETLDIRPLPGASLPPSHPDDAHGMRYRDEEKIQAIEDAYKRDIGLERMARARLHWRLDAAESAKNDTIEYGSPSSVGHWVEWRKQWDGGWRAFAHVVTEVDGSRYRVMEPFSIWHDLCEDSAWQRITPPTRDPDAT